MLHFRRPSRVGAGTTALHGVRVASRRSHRVTRRFLPSVRRRHAAARRHERQRRRAGPREARQLLRCCAIVVTTKRPATQRRQDRGRHSRHRDTAPVGCHHPALRSQAAGRTEAEVRRRNHRLEPAIRLTPRT